MKPLDRHSAIAVLGAGASGLTFADTLRELGFSRVVLFEREARVGGKTCTIDVDGRPHDLGATMGVPIDYDGVLKFSRQAGIETTHFPEERHYSLEHGREIKPNRWRDLPGVCLQLAKYLLLHATSWR